MLSDLDAPLPVLLPKYFAADAYEDKRTISLRHLLQMRSGLAFDEDVLNTGGYGGEELLVELCHKLGVKPGETTSDGSVTVEFAECLGMCEGAPCVLMNDECYGPMTLQKTLDLIDSAGGTNGQV